MRHPLYLLNPRPAPPTTPVTTPEVELNRVLAITTAYGGRQPSVPQSFFDAMAANYRDSNTHPHMGPFSHVSVKSGPWSDPTTWDAGTVPVAGSIVKIDEGTTVTYDLESDVQVKDIHVEEEATLQWATDRDTRLWIDTITSHGVVIMGTGDAPIPESTTLGKPRAEIVFWQSEAPLATTRLGLNTMGPTRIQGAKKASRLYSSASIHAGETTATLDSLGTAHWRVGDNILFLATDSAGHSSTDTQYSGPTQFYGPFFGADGVQTRTLGYRLSHDEVRTITAINGSVVTFDAPLSYDHLVVSGTLPHGEVITINPIVANLSRSIRFRSADPSSLQKRAHTMFMFHPDIDVRYVEARSMAHTDVDPSLVRPDGIQVTATNGGTVITNANNVRGRYAFHVHGTGPYFGRKQAVFKGLVAWAPTAEIPQPGWAITHHNSRVAIEECVVYNVRGAGIVSELGNEIGQWLNNTVAWCRGDGFDVSWGTRAEKWQNHNGHAGIAYESQARQILQQGNVASSSNFGWFFMQQDVAQLSRIPDTYSLRLYDPITQGAGTLSGVFNQDQDTYGIEQAQIPDFNNNLVLGSGSGFGVAHRQFTDRTDTTPMISRGFHCIATGTPFRLINYSFFYSFYDFLWTGPDGTTAAASLGNVAWQFMFVNGLLRNFDTGFLQLGLGFNYDGFWIDLAFESVTTRFTDFTGDFDTTAWLANNPGKNFPDDHPLFNLMGPWITDQAASVPGSRWVGTLRKWGALDSATQLPQPYPSAPRGAGGVEPLPGMAKPYFWLDPTSDTSLTNSVNSVTLKGLIVNAVGVRLWPDEMSSESFGPSTTGFRLTKQNVNATATDLVLRNGCFNDGVWKTRLWFVEHDRFTGEYFQFPIDLTISGLADDFLAANVVNPIAPAHPLLPEAIGVSAPAIVIPTTSPTITSAASITVEENAKLLHTLQSDDGLVLWTLTGGTDLSKFEFTASNGTMLRWVGDVTKDYEAPDDSDANNTYVVQVTATNPFGYSTTQTLTVTVVNKTEGVVTPFTDSFTRPDELLEMSPNWLRIGGEAGQAVVSGNLVRVVLPQTTGSRAAYLSPDTGSLNHYVQAFVVGSTGDAVLAVSITDPNNYISTSRNNGNVNLVSRVSGVSTILGTWAGASNSSTLRLEYVGGVATVKVNGATIASMTVNAPPPATTRCGVVAVLGTGNYMDSYAAGAL